MPEKETGVDRGRVQLLSLNASLASASASSSSFASEFRLNASQEFGKGTLSDSEDQVGR